MLKAELEQFVLRECRCVARCRRVGKAKRAHHSGAGRASVGTALARLCPPYEDSLAATLHPVVIASEAKQSMFPQADRWIASSLRIRNSSASNLNEVSCPTSSERISDPRSTAIGNLLIWIKSEILQADSRAGFMASTSQLKASYEDFEMEAQ